MASLQAAGTARPCFLWSLLEELPEPDFCGTTRAEMVDEVKAAANLVYGGEKVVEVCQANS